MLFNSIHFVIFFPLVTALYFLIPYRFRWLFLLSASSYFYAAFIPRYILVLFALIAVDYCAGILIERAQSQKQKRAYLIISIAANLGTLFVFKYFNFFNANIAQLAEFLHWNYPVWNLSLLLPIGLSFHVFQSLSYVIEVSRGVQKAERHLGIYALYVMFFPQLVAGPIERPQNMLHQFRVSHSFDESRIVSGLRLMLYGFAKKLIIADNAASIVNRVYANPQGFDGPVLALATILFALQIYCDFSGYSDIARGSARVLGFRLMENFRNPYLARSVSEFWRRWHISLTSWFKDYIYVSLGGSRTGAFRTYRNLIIIFLLSGLWHGANWTFIVWGALNGFYIIFSKLTVRLRRALVGAVRLDRVPHLHAALQTAVTFTLVCIGWIFFRASTITDAFFILSRLPTGYMRFFSLSLTESVGRIISALAVKPETLAFVVLSAALLIVFEFTKQRHDLVRIIESKPVVARWAAYYVLILWIFFIGYFGERPFIYFQF